MEGSKRERGSSARQREKWYDEEIRRLEEERRRILNDASYATSRMFPKLEGHVHMRKKIAKDYRDMMLNNVYKQYESEVQQAWNEFEQGKRTLQSTMLDISTERRKKLDHMHRRSSRHMISKKRRRRRSNNSISNSLKIAMSTITTEGAGDGAGVRSIIKIDGDGEGQGDGIDENDELPNSFMYNLEQQGMVRISLTPDEVNSDIEGILKPSNNNSNNSKNLLTLKLRNFTPSTKHNNNNNDNKNKNNKNETNTNVEETKLSLSLNHDNNNKSINNNTTPIPKAMPAAAAAIPASIPASKNNTDKIHILKGTLYYHDSTFEKGDHVAVYNNSNRPSSKGQASLRYEGRIVSITSKEIQMRSENGASSVPHRVFVSQLSNKKLVLKHV